VHVSRHVYEHDNKAVPPNKIKVDPNCNEIISIKKFHNYVLPQLMIEINIHWICFQDYI
jgi:hypothetical protein